MISATVALAASVLMHVLWNLIARHQPGAAWPLWWALLAHLILLAPWGFYALWQANAWSTDFLGLMALSASANALYFFGLWKSYKHAPVAMVYPLVRSSPVLIALWWLILTGESPGLMGWLGILISVAGLMILAGSQPGRGEKAAIPWALVAMVCTSVYSISDKLATGQLPGFAAIIGFISVGYSAAFVVLTLALRQQTGRWTPPQRLSLPVIVIGGLCVGLAYALVIHAMRFLPSAEVVAYSNTGIVLATLASIYLFGEKQRAKWRIAGSVVICIGLLLLAL
ncbi:EamA family transporter [Marinobacter sp.]|uniref:EamA family transporter n=1 Tax=Marinobacter sp. TaxID=50741 RepID=UPI0019F192AF|nr:EamA family transporter [Marinobacter sp.]MBE0486895.1 EamA family transporter [Marinobacter sp.]